MAEQGQSEARVVNPYLLPQSEQGWRGMGLAGNRHRKWFTLVQNEQVLVTGLILSWSVLGLAACLMPATFLGIWLGTHVHTKLSNASMRIAYGSILMFSGLMLLIKQI